MSGRVVVAGCLDACDRGSFCTKKSTCTAPAIFPRANVEDGFYCPHTPTSQRAKSSTMLPLCGAACHLHTYPFPIDIRRPNPNKEVAVKNDILELRLVHLPVESPDNCRRCEVQFGIGETKKRHKYARQYQ